MMIFAKGEIKMFCVARKCKSYWHFMSSCSVISGSSMWCKLCLRQIWEADCRKSEKPIVGNPTPLSLRLPRCHCLNCPSFTASIPFSCLPESQDSEFWDLTFISAPFSVGYLFKIWSQPCLRVKKAGLDSLSRGSFCVSEWEADLAFVRCQHFAAPARPPQTYFHCIVSS